MIDLSERAKSEIVLGILSIISIVFLGTLGYQLNTTRIQNQENGRRVIFNSWSNLESKIIQERDRCVNYAKELKKEYPQKFGDWDSRYLAYKIEGINGNPGCKKLIPGKKIKIPSYSNQ